MESRLYYECHITIAPAFGAELDGIKIICREYGFSVADLLMQKRPDDTPERSQFDTFATTRGQSYEDVLFRMRDLIVRLRNGGTKVFRYKIEDTLLDSQSADKLGLL